MCATHLCEYLHIHVHICTITYMKNKRTKLCTFDFNMTEGNGHHHSFPSNVSNRWQWAPLKLVSLTPDHIFQNFLWVSAHSENLLGNSILLALSILSSWLNYGSRSVSMLLPSFLPSDKWKSYPICTPAPPSSNTNKRAPNDCKIFTCYHSGFIAFNLFLLLSLWMSYHNRPEMTVIAQGYLALLIWSHRKILYYYVISQTPCPCSNYKKNQTQNKDSLQDIWRVHRSTVSCGEKGVIELFSQQRRWRAQKLQAKWHTEGAWNISKTWKSRGT